ncbi:hypothetical protein BGZ73_002302 [Actinomortierella ambigua]|nr:hypothetical protein BGZ73_002302 [Actinomortierella ambigua]
MSHPSYAYRYPCVVQDPTDPTFVLVIGVDGTTGNTLELTRVNIANINNPVPRRLKSITEANVWSSTADKACDIYPRDSWVENVPTFYVRQFGGRSFMSSFLSNGSFYEHFSMTPPLMSSKLYSSVGTFAEHKWVTAMASSADSFSGSPWTGLNIYRNASGTQVIGTFRIQQYPPADARLSVGTYGAASSMPVFGYVTVFDATGSKGQVFSTTSSFQTESSATALQALAPPVNVDMGGIVLSADAISNTMGSTGYIVDRAADDSTVLYSISPDGRSTPKLVPVAVNGNVPPFLTGRTSTVLDSSKLLLFGGLQNGTLTTLFHSFDTSTRSWSGPHLVKPYTTPSPPTKSSNVGAIVGGIAAAVIVLAFAIFFIIRRNRPRHTVVIPNSTNVTDVHPDKGDLPAVVMTDVVYTPEQQYLQHKQQQQQHQHVNSVYEPLVFTSEQPLNQPVTIYQPHPTVLQPQEIVHQNQLHETIYLPPQGAMCNVPTPPSTTASAAHGGASPSTSATYVDHPSTFSPATATIHAVHVPVTGQLNSPQYIPPPHGSS